MHTVLPEITLNPLIAEDQWPGKQKEQNTMVQTVHCAESEDSNLPGRLNRPSKGEARILNLGVVSGKLNQTTFSQDHVSNDTPIHLLAT